MCWIWDEKKAWTEQSFTVNFAKKLKIKILCMALIYSILIFDSFFFFYIVRISFIFFFLFNLDFVSYQFVLKLILLSTFLILLSMSTFFLEKQQRSPSVSNCSRVIFPSFLSHQLLMISFFVCMHSTMAFLQSQCYTAVLKNERQYSTFDTVF